MRNLGFETENPIYHQSKTFGAMSEHDQKGDAEEALRRERHERTDTEMGESHFQENVDRLTKKLEKACESVEQILDSPELPASLKSHLDTSW